MKYFTIAELTASSVADQRKIDNTPPPDVTRNLTRLIKTVLDPVRMLWNAPVKVNSGYRCETLNRVVRGAIRSQHMSGDAADITTGSPDGNRRLFDMIRESDIEFDQLIDESNYRWIHISCSGLPRRQILHL